MLFPCPAPRFMLLYVTQHWYNAQTIQSNKEYIYMFDWSVMMFYRAILGALDLVLVIAYGTLFCALMAAPYIGIGAVFAAFRWLHVSINSGSQKQDHAYYLRRTRRDANRDRMRYFVRAPLRVGTARGEYLIASSISADFHDLSDRWPLVSRRDDNGHRRIRWELNYGCNDYIFFNFGLNLYFDGRRGPAFSSRRFFGGAIWPSHWVTGLLRAGTKSR